MQVMPLAVIQLHISAPLIVTAISLNLLRTKHDNGSTIVRAHDPRKAKPAATYFRPLFDVGQFLQARPSSIRISYGRSVSA